MRPRHRHYRLMQPGINPENRLGFRRLDVAGREVVAAREQITTIVCNHLGASAGSFFAIAETHGDRTTWRADTGEALSSLSTLSPERAQALQARARDLVADIEALAARISAQGDAGRIAGHLLRLALVTPDGYPALHAAADQPVLVNWGHAAQGQVIPEVDGVARQPPTTAAAGVVEAGTIGARTTGAKAMVGRTQPPERLEPERGGLRRLAWGLPWLLFCGLCGLLWLWSQPLPPVIAERAVPPPPPEDPVPAAQERLAALRGELAQARSWYSELTALCVPLRERRNDRSEPETPPATAIAEPSVTSPRAPEPSPPPPPSPSPSPRIPPRTLAELPPPVPPASGLLPPVSPPPAARPTPTLCRPGWTPTQRPEVMMVLDGSGSMLERFAGASSRIDAAKGAISQVIQGLHSDIEVGLVSFTDCGKTSTPKKYGYHERSELLARIRGVSPRDRTSLANSIRRAGNAAKSVGPATVVVVSDGDDTCGGDPCAAARALKAQKPQLQINAIDLSAGGAQVLRCVARATGGRVFTPMDVDQMLQTMQEATGQPDAGRCNP